MGVRPQRTRVVAVVVCLAAMAACGSRRSHEDVVAAAGGARVTSHAVGAGQPADGTAADVAPGTASIGGAKDNGGGTGASATGPGAATSATASARSATAPGSAAAAAPGANASGAPTAQPRAGATAAKSPVRIASVGTYSGPAGPSLKGIADGVRVWVKWINDHGGLSGHPVELLVGDDAGDPARHKAIVQEYVEQRNVLAFVGDGEAVSGAGSVDYLTKAGVPVIGSEGAGDWFYSSPVYFPEHSHGKALLEASAAGVAAAATAQHKTNIGIIACVEVQVCRDSYDKGPALYAKYNLKVAYRALASFGQPDYTAECLNAKAANVEIFTLAMDPNSVTRIAASCARQGFHPIFSFTSSITVAQHRSDPNLEGAIILNPAQLWFTAATPETTQFLDAMKRYASGVEAVPSFMQGWVSGKVLELGAKELPEPATRQALLEGLWKVHGDVLPNLTGPLLYTKGKPATPTVCAWSATVKNKQWVAGSDGKRTCVAYDPNI
jgi:branched-chain amino acid transport system substrate-binding protein